MLLFSCIGKVWLDRNWDDTSKIRQISKLPILPVKQDMIGCQIVFALYEITKVESKENGVFKQNNLV